MSRKNRSCFSFPHCSLTGRCFWYDCRKMSLRCPRNRIRCRWSGWHSLLCCRLSGCSVSVRSNSFRSETIPASAGVVRQGQHILRASTGHTMGRSTKDHISTDRSTTGHISTGCDTLGRITMDYTKGHNTDNCISMNCSTKGLSIRNSICNNPMRHNTTGHSTTN